MRLPNNPTRPRHSLFDYAGRRILRLARSSSSRKDRGTYCTNCLSSATFPHRALSFPAPAASHRLILFSAAPRLAVPDLDEALTDLMRRASRRRRSGSMRYANDSFFPRPESADRMWRNQRARTAGFFIIAVWRLCADARSRSSMLNAHVLSALIPTVGVITWMVQPGRPGTWLRRTLPPAPSRKGGRRPSHRGRTT